MYQNNRLKFVTFCLLLFFVFALRENFASADSPIDIQVPSEVAPDTDDDVVVSPPNQRAAPTVFGGAWLSLGAGPATDGQTENVTPNNEVVGSIHTVVAHPTNADILYIGASNGGIWRTNNATATSPTWTSLTDDLGSLSISSLAFDPTDLTNQTLIAGIGRYSSFGRRGGPRTGLLRTTDGGTTWTELDGGGTLTGKNISGVVARGNIIVVSVNVADSFTCSSVGVFRSIDGGATFTQLTATSGNFPRGVAYDLSADPSNSAVLYSSAVFADICNGSSNGVYRSADTGATWTKVSDATMDALIQNNNTSNLEISVGSSGETYAAIINTGSLAGLFRSANGTTGWVQLDTPSTNENGTDVGLNPRGEKGPPAGSPQADIAGGQGAIHFSILASPTDTQTVYVGGDRQPRSNGDAGSFPNSIGATDFTGRLFRGDASAASGSQFVHLTHSDSMGAAGGGTASSSSPHADSREIVFDANGDMIEVDDGGVYRRTSPSDNTGDWFSINGDLRVTEMHDIAYDTLSNTAMSGNQDTGTTYQPVANATTWVSLTTADGGDVAVDNLSLAANNQSVRYSSFQNLGFFIRTVWNSAGSFVSFNQPALSVTSGAALQTQFVTPVVTNEVAANRLLIGGANGIYESTDQGETIAQISTTGVNSSSSGTMMVYGGTKNGVTNPDVLYAAVGTGVHSRQTSGGSVTATNYPGTAMVYGVAMDTIDWAIAYAIDSVGDVYMTTDAGANWTDVTGNLPETNLRSVVALDSGVFVGGNFGVYFMSKSSSRDASRMPIGVWEEFGTGLPNVPVWDMDYDATDDLLVIGTLGRGAWLLSTDVIPTAVTLESFSATAQSNGTVVIDWETTQEINHAGFNILRRPTGSRDDWSQVNESLIASTGTQAQGMSYQYVDTTVSAGTWDYLLEDVENDDTRFQHLDFVDSAEVQTPTNVSLTGNRTASPSTLFYIFLLCGLLISTRILLSRR